MNRPIGPEDLQRGISGRVIYPEAPDGRLSFKGNSIQSGPQQIPQRDDASGSCSDDDSIKGSMFRGIDKLCRESGHVRY
jgi:hypothetical protein